SRAGVEINQVFRAAVNRHGGDAVVGVARAIEIDACAAELDGEIGIEGGGPMIVVEKRAGLTAKTPGAGIIKLVHAGADGVVVHDRGRGVVFAEVINFKIIGDRGG